MGISVEDAVKELQARETVFVAYSQATKLPYVTCGEETYNDQVWFFAEEETLKEYGKKKLEDKILLMGMRYEKKDFPRMYGLLFSIGVNSVIWNNGADEIEIDLEKIVRKPDLSQMEPAKRPLINPTLQLSGIYFMQELRRPVEKEEHKNLRALEEELIANLKKSHFLVAMERNEENPKKINIPYLKNKEGQILQPVFSDIMEFEKFAREEIGDSALSEVKAELVREWIVSLMDKGYTSTSINRKLSSLRSFYKFLLRKGEVCVNPLQKITGPKNKKPLPTFLRESEMDKLLDEVDFGEGFKGCRDHMIIEMFYATGMRLSELIGLDDKNVDFSSLLIKVTGKRNKQRLIPFGEELKNAMIEYVNVRNEIVLTRTGAFFVRESGERLSRSIVENLVKRNLSKVVTLKKRSPHVLRHTFATTMLNHDAELGAIKELLGHESLATTEVYTHTTFEELKKVYNQAHPRA